MLNKHPVLGNEKVTQMAFKKTTFYKLLTL